MNNTLKMNRFRLLVRRQWTENKKVYLLLWGVISLSLVVLAFFSEKNDLTGLYILLFCFGGCVMATTLFSRWSDFGRSSFFLLLPASSAEKFLCGLFYGLILYIPVYILNFVFFRYIVAYILVIPFPNNLVPFSSLIGSVIKDIVSFPYLYIFGLLAFLFTQSLFMIITIHFQKRQALIFLLILLAIVMVHNLGMQFLMSNLAHIPAGTTISPGILIFFDPGFGYTGSSGNQPVSEYFPFIRLIRNLNSLIWLVVFSLLYLTAWYKLKEREL
jgi:hypothetical protein